MKSWDESRRRQRRGEGGFTLIEVMVAAILLVLVYFGMAQFQARGRSQLAIESHRRQATTVAQARLERIRRYLRYDDLAQIAANDTIYLVDGRSFTVSHAVVSDSPETQATTVTVTVAWNEHFNQRDIPRTFSCSTIIARSLPWSQ